MNRKKIIAITAAALAVVLVALVVLTVLTRAEADYSLLAKVKGDAPVYTKEKLPEDNVISLGSVSGRELTYQRDISAFFVKDTATAKVFTSGVSADSYTLTGDTAQDGRMYTLCQVGYTDFSGAADVFTNISTECKILERPMKNGIALGLAFEEFGICFTVEVWLNEHGLCARVPVGSIQEKKKFGITSITLFPFMGGVSNSEDGFIVYPDGSGSLYEFGKSDQPNPISTPIYFTSSFDLDEIETSILQGQQNVMIPAFGVTDGSSGVVTYVAKGDTTSYITLYPSGFSSDYNRIAASCMYRKSYSYMSPSNIEINEVEKNISATDFTVQFLFMQAQQGKKISYGDIAGEIREYMLETDRLNQKKDIADKIRADVQIIMSTRSNSGMQSGLKTLTTFEQVREIVETLDKDNRDKLQLFLLGWQQNGYGLNPSGNKAAGSVGSKNEFKELNKWLGSNDIISYAVADYVYAQSGGKNFNKSSQAVYNEMNLPITNADYDEYLLNPLLELQKLTEKRLPYLSDVKMSGLALDKVGYYLYDDYRDDRRLTREQTSLAMLAMAKNAQKVEMSVAVQGGNAYMLRGADCLYDLPEAGSGNTDMAYSIPFYQMIVHGVITYSGNVPGNMAADFDKQKLKWIEYGSVPSFILTYESSQELKNTYADNAFATDYKQQTEIMNSCIKEFNSELAFTAGEFMTCHEVIQKNVIRLTYSGGNQILINYNDKEVTVGSITVPAVGYVVLKGGE